MNVSLDLWPTQWNENRRRESRTDEAPAPKGRMRVAQYVEQGWALAHTLARKCWVKQEPGLSLRRRLACSEAERNKRKDFPENRYWTLLLSPICLLMVLVTTAAPSQKLPSRSIKSKAPTTDRRAEASHRNNLGAAYMNQQEFHRALNLFRQAATFDPKLEIAKVNQGIALVYLQKYGPARTILNNVTNADPGNVQAWYALGLMYKNQGDAKRALDAFQSAAKLAPNDPDVFYFIGLVQAEIGHQQEAIAAFQHALELNAFHASAE